MFYSIECVREWAESILHVPISTYPQEDAPETFGLIERTGGELSYPHDSPDYAIQIWSTSEADAQDAAIALAIACKTKPPTDMHINSMGVPNVFSYGREDGGYFIWQVGISLTCNIID